MPNLVGIGNSQVPTNAMLGGLAYQDPDNAIFTKVEPGLVSAIKARSQETITDVFVYDTKLDSDGGAWRHKCQDKSWYTEELGRDGRGQRKEFPSLAVIAVGNGGDGLIIYDGDDPNLSVWMTFKELAGQGIWGSANRTGVCAKNGMIVATQDQTIPAVFIDFITDEYYNWRTTASNFRYNYTHIANRNDASVTFGMKDYFDGPVKCDNMKCVDMMVEPDAPIDPERGLPRPTIALGGLTGLSILRGTWAGASPSRWIVRNSDNNNTYLLDKIKFDDTGGVIAALNNTGGNAGVAYRNSHHTLTGADFATYASWQEVYYYYNYSPTPQESTNKSRCVNTVRMSTSAKTTIAAMKGRDFALSSNSGLNLIERANYRGNSKNYTSSSASTHCSDSLGAYITKDFNTGWMTIGNNSDNTYKNTQVLCCPAHKNVLNSKNYVTNGDASNGTNGWGGGGGGTFSVSSGVFSYNITSGNHQITQQITGLTVGKKYKFSYTHKTGTTSAYIGQHSSSAAPNSVVGDRTGNSDQTATIVWVAEVTNPFVVIYGIGSGTHTWDNVSLVETYDLGTHRYGDDGNRVLNGDFKISGNTSGWSGSKGSGSGANAVLSIVTDGNYKSIKVHDAGNDGNFARGEYSVYRLVVGRKYVFSASFRGSNYSTIVTLGGANGDNSGWKSANDNEVWTNYFTATGTDLLITLQTASNAGAWGKWDQIKLYEVEDHDRTRNAKGLGATGLIRTSPVAENAELHYYHGFSLNNYLVQPYNADLAYGSHPNFTVSCWIKSPSSAANSYQCAIHWNKHANADNTASIHGWQMMIDNNNIPYFFIYSQGGTNSSIYAYGTMVESGWHHFAAVGTLGKHLTLYQNGRPTNISRNVWTGFDWDGTFGEAQQLTIGRYGGSNSSNYHLRGGICMVKIQRCALSANRIRRIYDDEKQLFTKNAKCTLHGTSDTILATSYDRITDTLSVGTSSGRSDFRGLRRVNSTDTAITTCISSSDGLIAEQ